MEKNKAQKTDSFINAKCFVASLVIIAALMVASYVASLTIPCEGIPIWKWILSPILVLGSDDMVTLLAVILFLLIIGGVFNALTNHGLMRYMIDKIAYKYAASRYKLMAVITLFFMSLGSLIGSFEEVVPMIPIVVALAIRLGWDALTGISMCLVAVGCGFAAGVFNPFTIGIAQTLAGLPMFSGAWFRAINFVLIYILLIFFIRNHAKKVDRGEVNIETQGFSYDKKKDKGVLLFAVIMLAGIVIVMCSALITALRDYTFVIVTLMFLIAGCVASKVSGMSAKDFGKSFGAGVLSMLPAVLMILMAASIKYTLATAGVLDVIVSKLSMTAATLPRWGVILFIYLVVLLMNFVIPSGSAKAVMLTPILVAIASPLNISSQLVIVAFAFGDGFSNVFYPTNPALLISLGLSDTSYSDWFKYSYKFQLENLLLTSVMLLVGLAIGV